MTTHDMIAVVFLVGVLVFLGFSLAIKD